MSDIDLPVLHAHNIDRNKRLRHLVSLITGAALSTSLIVAVAGPASATVREPARTAPISQASSDSGLPAVSLTAAAHYVHFSDGQFTLDTLNAGKAGVSSQALSTESALVASMNRLLDRRATTVNSVRDDAVDVASIVPAGAQGTTITIVPGITLTISSTGIQLSMTKEAVAEVENVLGFAQTVASLVSAILAVIPQAQPGGPIAGIVASALGLGNSLLKLCTASDGSATFTIPWPWLWPSLGLPSCSGISI